MNLIHRLYCRSGRWRHHLNDVLPWATDRVPLSGARVLELGSGPGLTTDWLATRTGSLTAVEYDAADAANLQARRPDIAVIHADATNMPVPEAAFDVVVCFTMLHHLPSDQAQDMLFAEAHRVLVPGGVFAGSDSKWGPLFAVAHVGDTMTLLDPTRLPKRLTSAGFIDVTVNVGPHGVRFRGRRP